jgi:hypothetical protein
MAQSKYGKYVFKNPKGKGPPTRKVDEQGITLSEELVAAIGKFNIQFNFVGMVGPHVLGDPPHKHDVDEILFFLPADPSIAPDLGGEVEIAMGDEWEKHVVNTAAVLCLPKGVPHAPVYVKKVTTPFYFGHCLLAPTYGSSVTPPGSV